MLPKTKTDDVGEDRMEEQNVRFYQFKDEVGKQLKKKPFYT